MLNIEILTLIAYGFFGGFLAGLLGVGGGVIYILILPLMLTGAGVCETEIVKYTIANSVFAIFIASLSGNIINIKNKSFYAKEIFSIGLPAALFSILAMVFVVSQNWYSKDVFNGLVIFLLAFMLIKMVFSKNLKGVEKSISNKGLTVIGSFSGIVSALTGLGGGILVVPLLQSFYGMEIKKAKNISLGVIGVMAFSLSVYNFWAQPNCFANEYQIGLIVLPTVLLMIIGVMLGSPAGVWISGKLKPDHIKIIFILLLASVIIRKLLALFSLF